MTATWVKCQRNCSLRSRSYTIIQEGEASLRSPGRTVDFPTAKIPRYGNGPTFLFVTRCTKFLPLLFRSVYSWPIPFPSLFPLFFGYSLSSLFTAGPVLVLPSVFFFVNYAIPFLDSAISGIKMGGKNHFQIKCVDTFKQMRKIQIYSSIPILNNLGGFYHSKN